jgi:predicted amidohydrolase YtcJ
MFSEISAAFPGQATLDRTSMNTWEDAAVIAQVNKTGKTRLVLCGLCTSVCILVQNRWPWRMHATYDETISRSLDVLEKVNAETPLQGLNWFFDHAETISDASIDRIAALGGGIAVQHRMAYQGEYFVERYAAAAAEVTPPVAKILERGVKVSAGTDATRVASYNPWVSLAWLITGKTVGGLSITPQRNCLDRQTAYRGSEIFPGCSGLRLLGRVNMAAWLTQPPYLVASILHWPGTLVGARVALTSA